MIHFVRPSSVFAALGLLVTVLPISPLQANSPLDVRMDHKAKLIHEIETLNILIYTILLVLTVFTVWLFKRNRIRYIHETGLAVLYGLIAGALIKYVGDAETTYTYLRVVPADLIHSSVTSGSVADTPALEQMVNVNDTPATSTGAEESIATNQAEVTNSLQGKCKDENQTKTFDMPPDSLWIPLRIEDRKLNQSSDKTYVYIFKGRN